MKQPGDSIDIGDLLGHPMEPQNRWARVTGFQKQGYDECGALQQDWKTKIIMRVFKDDDGDFPTGEYRMGRLCVPYMPAPDPRESKG